MEILVDQPSYYLILPVSLQLLVENALKHNMATTGKPLKILISLEDKLYIKVENNLQPKQQLDGSFQIGLKNLGERIKLVTGKDLIVEKNNERFLVKIPISTI